MTSTTPTVFTPARHVSEPVWRKHHDDQTHPQFGAVHGRGLGYHDGQPGTLPREEPAPTGRPTRRASHVRTAPEAPTRIGAPEPDNGETYANGLVGECPTCDDVDCGCLVGPVGRYWFRADYLLWWTRGSYVPPLVTTSTNPADGGILGRPTTQHPLRRRADRPGQPVERLAAVGVLARLRADHRRGIRSVLARPGRHAVLVQFFRLAAIGQAVLQRRYRRTGGGTGQSSRLSGRHCRRPRQRVFPLRRRQLPHEHVLPGMLLPGRLRRRSALRRRRMQPGGHLRQPAPGASCGGTGGPTDTAST